MDFVLYDIPIRLTCRQTYENTVLFDGWNSSEIDPKALCISHNLPLLPGIHSFRKAIGWSKGASTVSGKLVAQLIRESGGPPYFTKIQGVKCPALSN